MAFNKSSTVGTMVNCRLASNNVKPTTNRFRYNGWQNCTHSGTAVLTCIWMTLYILIWNLCRALYPASCNKFNSTLAKKIGVKVFSQKPCRVHLCFSVHHDDDCLYYHSWRNNAVIAFRTLSSFLTLLYIVSGFVCVNCCFAGDEQLQKFMSI